MLRLLLLRPARATRRYPRRLLGDDCRARRQLHWSISEPAAQLATVTTQPTNTPVATPAPSTLAFQATLTVLPTGRARRHATVPPSAAFAP